MFYFLLLLFGFISVFSAEKCSYENCPNFKNDMLNVHLICHTHDDAGWLKTADQYFWGTNRSISKASVNYILNSVFSELMHDPKKRFNYAESNFFSKWWDIQDDITKHQFVKLVNQGQFEFIGGGWVQNDEASTHYAAILDQMTLGHRFLNTTFGRCGLPKVAWQIDPFGHSRETASLFAQMGLEGLFFARIHYSDRDKRRQEKSMELIWQGSDDIGTKGDIFTSIFHSHYMPPDGFCFDEFCDDDPIIDDTRFESYNLQEKVDTFLKTVKKQSESFATNHIMLTMGGDFHFSNANAWFTNLDKLIKHVNQRQSQGSKVNVFYSTPTCYTRAVKSTGVKFTTKSDDFFPYANDLHSYWTGYYSSRPTFKGMVRSVSNLFQVCQSLDAIAQLDPLDWGDVDVLHRNLGIVQHHDGISGTAKQHVTNDYAKMLYQGIMECQQVANDAMKYLASPNKEEPPYHSLCLQLNETVCNVSQSLNSFIVTIQNGLSKEYRSVVRIPVSSDEYTVTDPDGENVEIQLDTTPVLNQLAYVKDRAPYELIFPVELPAFGFSTYFVKKETRKLFRRTFENKNMKKKLAKDIEALDYKLENELLVVTFDQNTGLMTSITDKRTRSTVPITQNFLWYQGTGKSTIKNDQTSGAYIFRPNGTKPHRIVELNRSVLLKKVTGGHIQEMRQTISDWVTQRIRLISQKPYVEFEWTIGPIPHKDNISREIITRFDSNIKSGGIFATDSNGRQIITRKRNFAPTYSYNNSEPIAANYYPVNTRLSINDATLQLTLLTDRTHGGSSMADGSMELMLHRRLLQDDYFGVEEALNETGVDGRGLVATGRHWLMLEKPAAAPRKNRFFSMEMFYQPLMTFAQLDSPFETYRKKFKTTFTGLISPLPQNLHILTIAQWRGTRMLLRIEHIFHLNEDHEYSRPVTVSLDNFFTTFDIVSLQEYSLSVLEPISPKMERNFTITLNPMEIRTFLADVEDKRGPTKKKCPSNQIRECLT